MTKKRKMYECQAILTNAALTVEQVNKYLTKKEQDEILLNIISIRGAIDVLRFKLREKIK